MKICEGVYAYIWKGHFVNNCNMFYFGEPLNMLFDTGLSNQLDIRFDEMKKDGLDPEKIEYLVYTHCHPDHFDDSDYLHDDKVTVAMHGDEIEFLNSVGPKFFEMFGMKFPDFDFNKILEEGKWNVNGTELEIYHTPGHSPGSISIYWPEKKALVCGDLVFKESVGRVDFPGGDGNTLKESIKKISELDIQILLPGHMDLINGESEVKRNFDMIEKYVFSMI